MYAVSAIYHIVFHIFAGLVLLNLMVGVIIGSNWRRILLCGILQLLLEVDEDAEGARPRFRLFIYHDLYTSVGTVPWLRHRTIDALSPTL